MIMKDFVKRPPLEKVPMIESEQTDSFLYKFIISAEILILELLFLYPERDIFFIARDMEYHYDLAKIMFKNEPSLLNRIHLINISRTSMLDSMVIQYCEQEIINIGQRVVLVDSGFNGNVIESIRGKFPNFDIKGHLIYSENPSYCSSYASMMALGISNSELACKRKKYIEDFIEHLPHYYSKAIGYRYEMNTVIPICPDSADTELWRSKSLHFMGQLYYSSMKYELMNSWKIKYQKMEAFISKIKFQFHRKIQLEIDLHYLFTSLDKNSLEVKKIIGLHDFLRKIKMLSESNSFRCNFVYEKERVSEVINSKQWECLHHNLQSYRVSLLEIEDSSGCDNTLIRIPDGTIGWGVDYQYDFKEIWRILDLHCPQYEVDEIIFQSELKSLLAIQGGMGVLRDIIENVHSHHFDIHLRDEIIGGIWGLIEVRLQEGGSNGNHV